MVQQNGPDLRKIESNLEKVAASIKNIADGLRETNKALKTIADAQKKSIVVNHDFENVEDLNWGDSNWIHKHQGHNALVEAAQRSGKNDLFVTNVCRNLRCPHGD